MRRRQPVTPSAPRRGLDNRKEVAGSSPASSIEYSLASSRATRSLPIPRVDGVEHRFVIVAGLRVHVAEAGLGDPLVLLHTSFEHWYAWRHLIPALAPQHRVICPDMRGCGWSGAPAEGYEKERLAELDAQEQTAGATDADKAS